MNLTFIKEALALLISAFFLALIIKLIGEKMKKIVSDLINIKDYKIYLMNNLVHVINYKSIIDINENEALIKINDRILKIYGKDFTLTRLDKNELLIKGIIKRIELNE